LFLILRKTGYACPRPDWRPLASRLVQSEAKNAFSCRSPRALGISGDLGPALRPLVVGFGRDAWGMEALHNLLLNLALARHSACERRCENVTCE
jgi:hypothetical protein